MTQTLWRPRGPAILDPAMGRRGCRRRSKVDGACRRIKKIMIVALARKLLIALWRYAKDGVISEGTKMMV
jgi:hypothetical protein